MSHCAWAQQATTTSLSLGNLVVLKISNPRALGKQGQIYQAAVSIVKCTALRAFKEMLFTWHPYGNITLHSCCLQLSSPFTNAGPSFCFPICIRLSFLLLFNRCTRWTHEVPTTCCISEMSPFLPDLGFYFLTPKPSQCARTEYITEFFTHDSCCSKGTQN